MPSAIPPRQSVEDQFTGFLIEIGGQKALAAAAPENSPISANGKFALRYGIRYLGKPHLAIIPELVAIDYGQMLNGEPAWDFLIKRSNIYPRAEVFGLRSDGKDDMTYVKNLDLAMPVMVLAFTDQRPAAPLGSINALICAQPDSMPERLRSHLPLFETEAAWLATL
ncbi:MAG: hypothetical protein UZ15_CFX003002551 [Chloroflexi bacterium OLB15]|nr:MAG: hypothetical protein UZ15_CFX003002551 [Chloroflexi bacterium OLB15]